MLDGSVFRADSKNTLAVKKAVFEQHGNSFDEEARKARLRKTRGSEARRRVARLAARQAVGWEDDDDGRLAGGYKGLRIVVLKGLFVPPLDDDEDDTFSKRLERTVQERCGSRSAVEKMTVFSKAGVVVVKFSKPAAAVAAVEALDGKFVTPVNDEKRTENRVEATYWDGVTDYTAKEDEEAKKKEEETRHDDFGDWLDNQELSEEFRSRVEE